MILDGHSSLAVSMIESNYFDRKTMCKQNSSRLDCSYSIPFD